MTKIFQFYIGALAILIFMGCAHKGYLAAGDSSAAVGEMLDQVNDAITAAKIESGQAPEIISVQVDLQLGTSSSANAGFPFGIILPLGQSSEDHLHKVSLTFAPKPAGDPAAVSKHNRALTLAVEEIYRSVAKANPHYQFQRGSMQIQCTLESGLSVSGNSSGSGGSSRNPSAAQSGVQLVPIQFGASSSNQSIQTITLNFGPRTEAAASSQSALIPTTVPESPSQISAPAVDSSADSEDPPPEDDGGN